MWLGHSWLIQFFSYIFWETVFQNGSRKLWQLWWSWAPEVLLWGTFYHLHLLYIFKAFRIIECLWRDLSFINYLLFFFLFFQQEDADVFLTDLFTFICFVCFKHYSSAEKCMSAFKAPLDPSTALGGFSGNNYSEVIGPCFLLSISCS